MARASQQSGQPQRRGGRIFFGWWIVAGAVAIQALQGGLLLQAFGAYFLRLQEEFGWDRAALAWSFSLIQLQNGVLGPVQGWLVDKVGPKAVLAAGVIMLALGFFLLSRVQTLTGFYLVSLVLSVGFGLSGYLTLLVTVANWFRQRRALALGLSATGLGIGGMLVPLVAVALSTYGWRATAVASGVIILAVGLPILPLMRGRPERFGLLPDGGPPRRAGPLPPTGSTDPSRDFTVRQAMATPAFWLISLGHGSALLVVGAIIVHLIPHLVLRLEVSLGSAALVVTVMTVTSILGQVGGGYLGDRMDKRMIAAVCMVAHTVALVGLAFAPSLAMAYPFAVLHGLAWGARGPLMGAIRADYFGRTSLGSIMGVSAVLVTMGIMAGPVFAGWMADRQGSYETGFVVLAALTGLASLFFLTARRPGRPGPSWGRLRRLAQERRARRPLDRGGPR